MPIHVYSEAIASCSPNPPNANLSIQRLLKALGYLSTADRSPEVEEDIQMHADTMYHKLLQQEAEIDTAKAEGRPIPKFSPIIPKEPLVRDSVADTELTPEQQGLLKTRLEKVDEKDQPAEEQAFRAELRAKAELSSRIKGIWDQQAEERKARQDSGQQTTWDKVMSVVHGNDGKK